MSDVKLQDWPEGVRLRITYCPDKEEPRAITSYAGEWHFFEPVSVAIEPDPEGFYVPARDYDRQSAEITRLRAELATARREGMEEAAKKADAIARRFRIELPEKWKDRPEGIPHDWAVSWEACAETAEEIAAAIRAAAKEDREP